MTSVQLKRCKVKVHVCVTLVSIDSISKMIHIAHDPLFDPNASYNCRLNIYKGQFTLLKCQFRVFITLLEVK